MNKPKKADKKFNPLYYLPPGALEKLAHILMYPSPTDTKPHADKQWLARQQETIAAIAQELKLHRPQRSLATFFNIEPTLNDRTGYNISGRLCTAHKGLNPKLIFWCFSQLTLEVGHHTNKYRVWLRKYPHLVTNEVDLYAHRMTSIATMYYTTEEFEYEFGDGKCLPAEYWLNRVRNQCCACVMAVVGSRAQMVADLRASMLARKKKKMAPRLLRMVEAWMDEFPIGFPLELRQTSEKMARELVQFALAVEKVKKEEAIRDARGGREPGYYEQHPKHRREESTTGKGGRMDALKQVWRDVKAEFKDKKIEYEEKLKDEFRILPASPERSSSRPGSSSGGRSSSRGRSESSRPATSSRPDSSHGRSSSRSRDETPRYTTSSRPKSPSGSYRSDHHRSSSPSGSVRSSSSRPPSRGSTVATSVNEDIRQDYNAYRPYAESVKPNDDNNRYSNYSTSSSRPGSTTSTSSGPRDSTPYLSSLRPSSTSSGHRDSTATIRPADLVSGYAGTEHLHVPNNVANRASWSSSVYSTDENGLRQGDPGFRGSAAPYNVGGARASNRPNSVMPLIREDDVALDADEFYSPSDDEEDGEPADEEGQYVPARANWTRDLEEEHRCPMCRADLSEMGFEERSKHANSCLDSTLSRGAARGEDEVESLRSQVEGVGLGGRRESRPYRMSAGSAAGSTHSGAGGSEYGGSDYGSEGEGEYGVRNSVSNRVSVGSRTAEVHGEADRRGGGGRFSGVVRSK